MVPDLGDLRNRNLCTQHIADSCLAWLTLNQDLNFDNNVYCEVLRSKYFAESWDALLIIEETLNCWQFPRPPSLREWQQNRDSKLISRPGRKRTAIVRNIALAEEAFRLERACGVLPMRTQQKNSPKLSACDAVARSVPGLDYDTVRKAYIAWGPNCEHDPRYFVNIWNFHPRFTTVPTKLD